MRERYALSILPVYRLLHYSPGVITNHKIHHPGLFDFELYKFTFNYFASQTTGYYSFDPSSIINVTAPPVPAVPVREFDYGLLYFGLGVLAFCWLYNYFMYNDPFPGVIVIN